MTKTEFKKWAREMCRKAESGHAYNDCDVIVRSNVTVCVDSDGKIGIAKCHPDDIFDYDIGIAIAYARCKGIEVPKVTNYKRLSEMVNGDIFKIKISGYHYRYIGKDDFNRYVCRNMTTNRYDAFFDKDEYEMVE